MRFARIMVISASMFLLAWVIREVLFQGDTRRADELVQRIRLSGV